jgi:hypothetical protein
MGPATREVRYEFNGLGTPPVIGSAAGDPMSKKITGTNPTATYKTGIADTFGVIEAALTADSEIQNVCWYFGDVLMIPTTRLLRAEFRARLATALGTTATTMAAFGLTGARHDTIDTVAQALLFRVLGDGSAAVVVESDDGTTDNDDKATGITLGTAWKRFQLDFSKGMSDVRFNGEDSNGHMKRLADTVTFNFSAYTGNLQFFAQIQKAANTNLGVLQLDYFKFDFKEP